jgi:hypothetical protein
MIPGNLRNVCFGAACLLALLAVKFERAWAADSEQWGIYEVKFDGPTEGNPYADVQFSTTFHQGKQAVTVAGFYDGDGVYKVRFSPPTTGEWRYETKSNQPGLNAKSGKFAVNPPTGSNHGPVHVFDTYYLRYADGTPYHQFGTTCYAWVHQPLDLQELTLKTLAEAPFNKIRFCVFPKSYYIANKNEPERFPFLKNKEGKFDFNRPDPVFWRHFEQRVLDLQKLGIEADLILWHPYDRWGFAEMSAEQDDRYLRYCIARLSAFRNVWWSLANEYDFMTDQRPGGHKGNKKWEDWDRFFSILQKEDPHQRLRGIHNGKKMYDHTQKWVTHASLQTSDLIGGVRYRAQYGKPVIYDECRYEGNLKDSWGNLTARDMVREFWLGTLAGCYVGHGETYKHPSDILWWSKGGELHGESPKRIAWLKTFMAKSPPFYELKPLGDGNRSAILAKDGEFYLAYALDKRPLNLTLAGNKAYKVEEIDPWDMTVTPIGTAQAGDFSLASPITDRVYRFTPAKPDDKNLPLVRRSTDPTSRPRVVVLTDFPPVDVIPIGAEEGPPEKRSDPDDVQSMVRFLLYANEFDIEGLVASSGTLANVARKRHILDLLDIYAKVEDKLWRQDHRFPTARELKSVTWEGRSGTYGKPSAEVFGKGKETEASDALIKLVDRPDPRPVWICVWGGPAELAQALWTVRETRTPSEVARFMSKLRVYLIGKQDGSAQWMLDTFPNLFIILSERNYMGMFWNSFGANPKLSDLDWLNENIRNGRGPLAAAYPRSGVNPRTPGVQEGDTPSFLHLVSAIRGLNDPEKPDQGGWGGKFKRADPKRNHWIDDPAGGETVWRWREEVQKDFARRADWMKDTPR